MIPRLVEPELLRLATQYPVVTITGPRQSGKTTLVKKCFSNALYYSLEDPDVREAAFSDPKGFLSHRQTMIIDEVQKMPSLLSYIQGIVDDAKLNGRFILTGSQQFELLQTISQSLAGRTAIIKLLPLSMGELPEVPSLRTLLYRGFYPRIVDLPDLNPSETLSFYTNTYLERDLRDIKEIKNLGKFEAFIRLCACNIGQILNKNRLGSDLGVDGKTIDSWFSLLQAGFIAFLLPPHFKNFRKRLVKSPKLYFYDVGLASYLLGIRSKDHVDSHPLKGYLFENMIIVEKLKERYNRVETPHLYYFRDSSGNEVDLLVEEGEVIHSFEIKLSQTLSKGLFRGLDFYKKLNPNNKTSTLIYTGNEKSSRFGHLCTPYDMLFGGDSSS